MEIRKSHILVLDDDELIRDMLRRHLERQGYAVSTAAEGRDGLELLRRRPADLALIDIMMPGMGGIETLMEVHREHPQMKTVLISGKVDVEQASFQRLVRQFGVQRVLSKPVELPELMATVRELLEIRN